MDYLWTPWRYNYIAGPKVDRCIFCDAVEAQDDRKTLIVFRGKKTFVILNRYPYTSGHVMVMPYAHVPRLAGLDAETTHELMDLAVLTERVLERVYSPQGLNLGMNLGHAAGAGVAGHLHLHAMPRWIGDTSFITTVAETRVLPEDLETTWRRLREAFKEVQGTRESKGLRD